MKPFDINLTKKQKIALGIAAAVLLLCLLGLGFLFGNKKAKPVKKKKYEEDDFDVLLRMFQKKNR